MPKNQAPKIAYIYFSHPGGSEVYFDLLKKNIRNTISIKIPKKIEFFPFLIKPYIKKQIGSSLSSVEIIHTEEHMAHFLKGLGKKLVVTIHHNVLDENYQKYTNFSQKIYHYFWVKPNLKRTLQKTDKVIAVSKFTKKSICNTFNISPRKVKVIYNGVDTNMFSPSKKKITERLPNRVRLLFVGNTIKRKGFDLLPLIMKRLGKGYELYFTSGLKDVKKIEKKFGLTKNMHPLGKLSLEKLVEEYNKCDLLIFPSRLEGFGYVITEAMACGKPVVSTNYSAMPEIVDNKNGVLCPLNDVDCFVEGVKTIVKKKAEGKDFANNRKKIIEKFSIEIFLEKMNKFYNNILMEK